MEVLEKRREISLDEFLAEVWKALEQGGSMDGKVLIKANPKIVKIQQQDMEIIEKLIAQIKAAEGQRDVFIQSAITVGYVNAMKAHKVITESELKRLNVLIEMIAERRLSEVQKIGRARFFRTLFRFGKVGAHERV